MALEWINGSWQCDDDYADNIVLFDNLRDKIQTMTEAVEAKVELGLSITLSSTNSRLERHRRSQKWRILLLEKLHNKLETSIDDERQFKMAKRPQATSDATVRKRFFRYNFVTFCHRSNRIAFLESANFSTCLYSRKDINMQIFNFLDGHVTTFLHHSAAYICQVPGHRLSRLA